MAAEKGSGFLVKIGDGGAPEGFTTIGGMRSTSLTVNSEPVDITNKQSGGWRELLAGAGVRRLSVAGTGVFTDSAAETDLQAKALAASLDNYEIVFDSGDKFTGAFQVATLDYSGEFNGERTYSLSLESSGPVAFTAAP
ncbi:MAG: phage major tail protein, TP901-1 family [Sphingomonadales bacterium]|nr:phage major tail protein, TP901-1 family [Sphingomonadales bacterium]